MSSKVQKNKNTAYSYNKNNTFAKAVIKLLFSPFLHLFYEYRVTGKENIPPDGSAVIVMKHQSWVDIPAGTNILPKPGTILGKRQLLDNILGDFSGTILEKIGRIITPLTSFFLTRIGMLAIDRDNPLKLLSSFKILKELLEQGEYILFYPEGGIVKGRTGEFKSGLINAVLRFQKTMDKEIKFIPVGVSYGKTRFFRKKLLIKIGEAIIFSWKDKNVSDTLQRLVDQLTDYQLV